MKMLESFTCILDYAHYVVLPENCVFEYDH